MRLNFRTVSWFSIMFVYTRLKVIGELLANDVKEYWLLLLLMVLGLTLTIWVSLVLACLCVSVCRLLPVSLVCGRSPWRSVSLDVSDLLWGLQNVVSSERQTSCWSVLLHAADLLGSLQTEGSSKEHRRWLSALEEGTGLKGGGAWAREGVAMNLISTSLLGLPAVAVIWEAPLSVALSSADPLGSLQMRGLQRNRQADDLAISRRRRLDICMGYNSIPIAYLCRNVFTGVGKA